MGALKTRVIQLNEGTVGAEDASGAIGVASGLGPEQVIRLVRDSGLSHLVQKESLQFEAELAAACKMASDPKSFLDHPLEVIWGQSAQVSQQRQSFVYKGEAGEHKRPIIEQFNCFLNSLPGARTIEDQALMIADELYTNGSKNAWAPGVALFHGAPSVAGTVEFFAEAHEDRLVIGCRDSYGKLETQGLVNRIATCFEQGVAQSIRHGIGGAGIGSYMVYDACISYYAGAEQGKRTVVCVVLPLGMSRRSAAGLAKNIHFLRGLR